MSLQLLVTVLVICDSLLDSNGSWLDSVMPAIAYGICSLLQVQPRKRCNVWSADRLRDARFTSEIAGD